MAEASHYATDIVIIGSGAAGIAAGIEALDAGASVIVLEKAPTAGGAAIISGGGCCLVQTPLQQQLGIDDNPDLAFADWIKWGGPTVDRDWARYYIEHSLHDLYFWAESLGVKWVALQFQEGNSVDRWTRAERFGLGLMTQLIKGFRARGGEIVEHTEITGLSHTNSRINRVAGINHETRTPVTVDCQTVIVATGGFNSNLDMVLQAKPELRGERILEGSGFGSTGEGHQMIRDLGGCLTHMEQIWFYCYATPDYKKTGGNRGIACRHIPGYIWVNQQGRRFHNESVSGGNSGSPALLAQSPRHCWAIVDTPMKAGLELADPYYRDGDRIKRDKVEELLQHSPFVKQADTLAGLAEEIGVDTNTFLGEIERYNKACHDGLQHEPAFGKPLDQSKPFDTAPYYAIQFFPLARKNFGGVKTDRHCRVLDKDANPIPGLYAAGEVAGMAGGHINGSAGLEGTMLGPSLFSGRVAGGWAANEAGHGGGFIGKPNRQ